MRGKFLKNGGFCTWGNAKIMRGIFNIGNSAVKNREIGHDLFLILKWGILNVHRKITHNIKLFSSYIIVFSL